MLADSVLRVGSAPLGAIALAGNGVGSSRYPGRPRRLRPRPERGRRPLAAHLDPNPDDHIRVLLPTAHRLLAHLHTCTTDHVANAASVVARTSIVHVRKYYTHGGTRVALRAAGVVYYLHTDHLGSVSLITDHASRITAEQRFLPYGGLRWGAGTFPTDVGFTGHRGHPNLGLVYMRARYYHPRLGRFVSADTIVPGAADGAGGGATTIGYNERTRLTPLTVAFHEAQFIGVAGNENRELLQFGPPALWDGKVRQEHNVPLGPANPQALNRYAYCLGNPLRYVDPAGHDWIQIGERQYTLAELRQMRDELANLAVCAEIVGLIEMTIGGWMTLSGAGTVPGILTGLAGFVTTVEGIQLSGVVDYLDDVIDKAEDNHMLETDIITLRLSRVENEGVWYNLALVLTSDLTPDRGNYMWGITASATRYAFIGRAW